MTTSPRPVTQPQPRCTGRTIARFVAVVGLAAFIGLLATARASGPPDGSTAGGTGRPPAASAPTAGPRSSAQYLVAQHRDGVSD